MKKICLIGSFGAYNLGDELILSAALDHYGVDNCIIMTADGHFSSSFYGTKLETVPPFPSGIRSFWSCLTHKAYRTSILTLNNKINHIVFVGGGLMAIKTRAYFLWWGMVKGCLFFCPKKPIVWEYQGIDKPRNFLERYFLKTAFRSATSISVRDKASKIALESSNIKVPVVVKNDRVFEYFGSDFQGHKETKKYCLVNAINPIEPDLWERIKSEASKQNLKIRLLILDKQGDITMIPEVESIFPPTKEALLSLFQASGMVIAERFHGIVLGCCFVPDKTFSLRKPYAKKVLDFCDKKSVSIF